MCRTDVVLHLRFRPLEKQNNLSSSDRFQLKSTGEAKQSLTIKWVWVKITAPDRGF